MLNTGLVRTRYSSSTVHSYLAYWRGGLQEKALNRGNKIFHPILST